MTIILRPHQIAAADAVEDAYRAGMRRPLVDVCVGGGKSLTMGELARRAWARGERSIILAHRQELVKQNAAACASLGLQCGINASKLGERTWRAPVISAMIHSVYSRAQNFGPIQNIFTDECHLIPHAESGMYREFHRAFPNARAPGFSGTVFRLQGGSLVEGEGAPFDAVVYQYEITDGIRDGYLVPAFSAPAVDKIDISKLRTRSGEYTGESQDAQMLALMDSHIAQMKTVGAGRRAWLVFEASQKSAIAMTERLKSWGIRAAIIIDKTPNREEIIRAYDQGLLDALVCVEALTTGFDVQRIDLVAFRRRTKSLGLYLQMAGRGLRTIGGNIAASIAAGKSDCLYFDFADLVAEHGPLDWIRPKDTVLRMVSCESCSARNAGAAMRCWACDEPMTKLCPSCLGTVVKGTLDCPTCGYDMRTGTDGAGREPQKLLETPTGAALISSYSKGKEREGGWLAVRKAYRHAESGLVSVDTESARVDLAPGLQPFGEKAKWIRADGTILVPNGASRTSAMQIDVSGKAIVVPLPSYLS